MIRSESYIREVNIMLAEELKRRLNEELPKVATQIQQEVVSKYISKAENSLRVTLAQHPRGDFDVNISINLLEKTGGEGEG